MSLLLEPVRRLRTGVADRLTFEVPPGVRDVLWQAVYRVEQKKGAETTWIVDAGKWYKPRTNAQNKRLHGILRYIAMRTGSSIDVLRWVCEQRAISRGYPADQAPKDGPMIARSSADVTTVEFDLIVEEAIGLAAEERVTLPSYYL